MSGQNTRLLALVALVALIALVGSTFAGDPTPEAPASEAVEKDISTPDAPRVEQSAEIGNQPNPGPSVFASCTGITSKATCESTVCGRHGLTCDWDGQAQPNDRCNCPVVASQLGATSCASSQE